MHSNLLQPTISNVIGTQDIGTPSFNSNTFQSTVSENTESNPHTSKGAIFQHAQSVNLRSNPSPPATTSKSSLSSPTAGIAQLLFHHCYLYCE